MNKLIIAASLALIASAAGVQTASAWLYIPKSPAKVPANVGEPFQPFQHVATESELRADCEDKGGEFKRRFNGNDFEWVCVG